MSTKNKGLRIILIPPHLEVRRLSQCGYPDVQRLLEDDAYLKPPLIRGNTVNKPFNAREGNNLVRSGKPLEQGCCGTSLSSSEQYNYSEKEGCNRPVINLKESNQYIIFLHFKKDSLLSLKTVLQKNEYMCKLELKDACLCVPLSRNNRKKVMFRWERTLL